MDSDKSVHSKSSRSRAQLFPLMDLPPAINNIYVYVLNFLRGETLKYKIAQNGCYG